MRQEKKTQIDRERLTKKKKKADENKIDEPTGKTGWKVKKQHSD